MHTDAAVCHRGADATHLSAGTGVMDESRRIRWSRSVPQHRQRDADMDIWCGREDNRLSEWAMWGCLVCGKKRKRSESASVCVAVTSQVERRLTEMERLEAGGGEWRWVGRGEVEEGDPVRSRVDDCRRKGRGDGRHRRTQGEGASEGGVKGLVRLAAKHDYIKAAVVSRQCFSRGKQLWQV